MVLATGAELRQALVGDCSRASRSAAQPPQTPKISMVWLTSEKPCSRATSAAQAST